MAATKVPVINNDAAPAISAVAVTPTDGVDLALTPTRALWVGSGGAVAVMMIDGTTVTFAGVATGTLLPIRVSRVNATGTTASSILALY